MNRTHPSLRLLPEIRRLERLAFRFSEPANVDEVWAALHDMPFARDDAPGWFDRLLVPVRHGACEKVYGQIVHFQRAGFFSTALVPFTVEESEAGMI